MVAWSLKIAVMVAALAGTAARAELPPAPSPADLVAAMAGSFATRADDAENNFAETRVVFANPALAAALAGDGSEAALVYSSLLSGPDRKPYRRRVTIITRAGDVLRSEAYAFADAMRFAAAMPTPDELAALRPGELVRGIAVADGADCAMRWVQAGADRWRGTIAPADCRLWSERRGGVIGLEAETRLAPGRIEQTERGFDASGAQLFGKAPGVFIIQEAAAQPD